MVEATAVAVVEAMAAAADTAVPMATEDTEYKITAHLLYLFVLLKLVRQLDQHGRKGEYIFIATLLSHISTRILLGIFSGNSDSRHGQATACQDGKL